MEWMSCVRSCGNGIMWVHECSFQPPMKEEKLFRILSQPPLCLFQFTQSIFLRNLKELWGNFYVAEVKHYFHTTPTTVFKRRNRRLLLLSFFYVESFATHIHIWERHSPWISLVFITFQHKNWFSLLCYASKAQHEVVMCWKSDNNFLRLANEAMSTMFELKAAASLFTSTRMAYTHKVFLMKIISLPKITTLGK